jgi:hypothetical protein
MAFFIVIVFPAVMLAFLLRYACVEILASIGLEGD